MELQRSRPQYGDSQSRLSLRERNGCESAASQDRLNVPEVLEALDSADSKGHENSIIRFVRGANNDYGYPIIS